jgi:cell division protein FtsL
MSLLRRLMILISVAALCCGISVAWWQYHERLANRLEEQTRALAEAEDAANVLARDLRSYEAAKREAGAQAGFARHEKVAIGAKLTPAELTRITEVFARVYGGDGFFLLKNFSLAWGSGAGGAALDMQFVGEKVFVR